MSRFVFLVALPMLGCTVENDLRYLSTLPAQTHGVVLSEDGIESYVAMNGTTCTIETAWGCPTEDVDLPSQREQILDHFEGRTLARSPEGLHLLDGLAWDPAADLEVADVHAARLTHGGALVLHGSVEACTLRLPSGASVGAPGEACSAEGRAAVDREADALWLASGDHVFRIAADGVLTLDTTDDLVARDDTLHVSYMSEIGASKLRAVDDLGREQWAVRTTGPVVSIATRGGRGDVLVLQKSRGQGLLERRSGTTGALLGSHRLPGAEGEMVVSANGVGLAIELDDEVHYYVFEIPGEPATINLSPAACPDLLDRTAVD